MGDVKDVLRERGEEIEVQDVAVKGRQNGKIRKWSIWKESQRKEFKPSHISTHPSFIYSKFMRSNRHPL